MLLVVLVLGCHRRAWRLGSQTTNRFFNYSRDISAQGQQPGKDPTNPANITPVWVPHYCLIMLAKRSRSARRQSAW
jgi:hypothetical protein